MTRARDLANLLDSGGDVKAAALDNATTSLSDLSVTATASELNIMDGVTATTAELNLLDGVTATTAELNYVDGVTSNIQTQIDNVASDVVSDTTPQLGGDLSSNGNDVNFGDNDKAQFGAGNDLQIFHDGTNNWINDTGTGNLLIGGGNEVRITSPSAGELMATFVNNGAVNLYHDNSLKFNTTSNGIEASRPASNGTIQSWKRGTTEIARLEVQSTDNLAFSAMQGGGSGLVFWGSGGTDPIISPLKLGLSNNGDVQLGRSSNRFKNLSLSAEGGSTAHVDVRQGSAKVWANFDMLGTYTTRDSYNVSSLSDNGTGAGTCNYNNDFTNANRAVTGTASTSGSSDGNRQFTVGHQYAGFNVNETAGANRITIIYDQGGSGAKYDADHVAQHVHGDLA